MENVKKTFNKMTSFIPTSPILMVIYTIISISAIHYLLINVYITMCVPQGIFGAIKNILYLGNPMCHMINGLQYELSSKYITYLVIITTGLVTYINKCTTNSN